MSSSYVFQSSYSAEAAVWYTGFVQCLGFWQHWHRAAASVTDEPRVRATLAVGLPRRREQACRGEGLPRQQASERGCERCVEWHAVTLPAFDLVPVWRPGLTALGLSWKPLSSVICMEVPALQQTCESVCARVIAGLLPVGQAESGMILEIICNLRQ